MKQEEWQHPKLGAELFSVNMNSSGPLTCCPLPPLSVFVLLSSYRRTALGYNYSKLLGCGSKEVTGWDWGGTLLLNKTWKNFSTISFSHSSKTGSSSCTGENWQEVNISIHTSGDTAIFSGIYYSFLFHCRDLLLHYCVLLSALVHKMMILQEPILSVQEILLQTSLFRSP